MRDTDFENMNENTATDQYKSESEREWRYQKNEVLRRERDGELFHVRGRYEDVDTGQRKYELSDDTHTTQEYWHAEDARDCFEQTSAVVLHARKPLQVLDGRLYETDPPTTDTDRSESEQ